MKSAKHLSHRRTRGPSRRRRRPSQAGGGVLSFTGDLLNDLFAIVVRAIGTLSSVAEVGVDTVGRAHSLLPGRR